MIDFEQDAAAPASSDALQRIAELAKLMVEQQAAVAAAETALALAKAALFRTETEDLPDLMEELQLSELKLTDGSKVSVKRDYHCGLSEDRRPAGLAWLEEHGFSGLIKTDLVLSFGREEAELAAELAEKVAELAGREVALSSNVHPATLKSFVKEQMETETPLPPEAQALFAVHPFNRAKLTAPRVTAAKRAKRAT